MWSWLKKNFRSVQNEDLVEEIKRILDDEDILKKRKERAIAKFEKFLQEGGALSPESDVDDDVALV